MTPGVPGETVAAVPRDTGLLWGLAFTWFLPQGQHSEQACSISENGASCPSSRPEEQTQNRSTCHCSGQLAQHNKRSHVRNVFCESVSMGTRYLQ